MIYINLFLISTLFIFLIYYFEKTNFKEQISESIRQLRLLTKFILIKTSDTRKEKFLILFSKKLIIINSKILITIFPIALILIILDILFKNFLNFLISLNGILIISILMTLYLIIKKYGKFKL